MKSTRPSILAKSVGALLALAVLSPSARAGQLWDGGGADGLWSNSLNWDADTLPDFTQPLTFDGSLQLAPNNNTTASVAGLTFAATAGIFTLSGNAITLTGGITNNSANTQTVSFASITLGADQTFNASNAALSVTPNIALGTHTLTIDGPLNTTLGGALTGTGGLTKQGVGTLLLNGANTYTGTTSINDIGAIKAGSSTAFAPTSAFFVNGTLDLGGFSNSVGSLGGLATGFVQNVGATPATLTIGGNNSDSSYAGVIRDGAGGSALSIDKTGTGTQTLTGTTSTYTGGTTLENGTLFADSNAALGTGPVTIKGSPTFGSNTDSTAIPNNITFGSTASGVTVVASTHLAFNGNVDLNGGIRTITGSTAQAEITFAGVISNGGVTFNSPVNYTAFLIGKGGLDVANTYTGLTTVNDNTFLVMQKVLSGAAIDGAIAGNVVQNGTGSLDYFQPDQISDTATVTINGPGNFLGADLYAGMQLNNHNETIGALLGASTGIVHLGSATLTVGAGNFSGLIADGFSGVGGQLVKNTNGRLILTGANTYTGATMLNGGTLDLGSAEIAGTSGPLGASAAVNPGNIVFGGGTLQYSAVNQNDYSGRFSTAANQAYRVDTNGQNVTWATALTSSGGSLTKFGNGMLTLTAAETYTGATTVKGGVLKLDFSAAGAPAINIINNTANNSALILNGGTLNLTGKASTTNSQRFNGLTLNAGASVIQLNANATANPLLLSLGAIAHNSGGTVNFILPSGVQSATNGITTSTLNTNGILGAFATVGGTDWAVNSTNAVGGNIVGLASGSYTLTSVALNNPANYLNNNISVDSSQTPTGPINPNTLRFNTAAAETMTLTGINVITTGGLLVTSSVGANLSTITGGTLEGAAGADLSVIQNNTAGGLTIGSVIADNGGATALTKSGNGTLTLTAVNTYTGGTNIDGGRLVVTSTGHLGTGGIFFHNDPELVVDDGTTAEPVTIDPGVTGRLSNSNTTTPATFTGQFTLGAASTLAIGSADNTGVIQLTLATPPVVDPTAMLSVDFGTLRNGNATGFQAISSVAASTTVGAGGTLDANGFNSTINNLQGGGTLTNSSATAVTYTVNAGNFSGTIQDGAGQVALTKETEGLLTLSGQNTYTGPTTVNAGTLKAGSGVVFDINNVAVSGAFAPASAFLVNGTLDLNGFSNSVASLSGLATGIVQNSGAATGSLFIGSNNLDATFNGLIRDGDGNGGGSAMDIVKTGMGRQTFTSNNTYTGNTFLREGSLFSDVNPGAASNTAFGSGVLFISGGTRLGSTQDSETISNPISVLGDFAIEANTHIALTGNIDLNDGIRTITGSTANAEIRLAGGITGGGITFNSPVNYTAFIMGNGDGFDVANTYTGLTTVNDNVFLVLNKVLPFGIDGAIAGNVVQNGTGSLDFFQPDQISNTASVTINGPGNFLGADLYAGMQLNNHDETIGALFGASTGIVHLGSATLTVGAGNFAGVIADGFSGVGGQLTKNTTGTLTLSGANTFTGNTNINNGTLVLNGSVQSPTVLVNFAGTLTGTGTAAHDVRNAGLFNPGGSSGAFHIGGNYVQTGAGAMVVEIAGTEAGQHGLATIAGAAALDGDLRLVQVGKATLKIGDKVTFLTSAGGVTGKFASVTNPFTTDTIVTTEVVYETNSVSLEAQQGSFSEFADEENLTPNQHIVASVLDKVATVSSQKDLIAFLDGEPLGNLPHDFDRIAPEELQAIYTVGVSQANVQTANLQRRMDDIRAGNKGFSAENLAVSGTAPQDNVVPPATPTTPEALATPAPTPGAQGPQGAGGREVRPPSDGRFGAFITGVGEFTRVGDTANASGYDLSTGGFTLGADYRFNEHFAVGINAGYARSNAGLADGGKVNVDGASFGVYATYFDEGFYADAAIEGVYNSYDTRRSALQGTATGSTTGGEVNALIATGFDFTADSLRIGPTASFQYTSIGFDSFRESGSLAPLQYGSQSSTSMRTAIGGKASYEYRYGGILIRPELRAAWQHEFGDAAYAINSSPANGGGGNFTVQGAEISRDSLLLGLGVAVLWNDRTSTYLYYDGELGRSNYSSNNVTGGMRMAF